MVAGFVMSRIAEKKAEFHLPGMVVNFVFGPGTAGAIAHLKMAARNGAKNGGYRATRSGGLLLGFFWRAARPAGYNLRLS